MVATSDQNGPTDHREKSDAEPAESRRHFPHVRGRRIHPAGRPYFDLTPKDADAGRVGVTE